MRKAIENDQFNLLFMPIYTTGKLDIHGAEVLIRCSAPELNGIGPDTFIPIAEEYGLIRDIDLWVIEKTFQYIHQHLDLLRVKNTLFCINISALELVNKTFPEQLQQLLLKYRINPNHIELELTETSLINVDEHSISLLHELKKLGVSLSLDDFGTGYTAFNQLLNYPVSCLKIDRSFVSNIDKNKNAAIIDTIITLADSLNVVCIAEGVETELQRDYLLSKNCRYIQGYLYSKPQPISRLLVHLGSPQD